MPRLGGLPLDVLWEIARNLESESSINSLSRTNRLHFSQFHPFLLRHTILHSKSAALNWAARNQRDDLVQELISSGADINTTQADKHIGPYSCVHQKATCTDCLFGHDCLEMSEQRAPLSHAAEIGNEKILKMLIARPEIDLDQEDERQRSAILFAVMGGHENIVKLLLARGARAQRKDLVWREHTWLDTWTPLSYATEKGNLEMVRILLGAKDVILDTGGSFNGWRPFTKACSEGYTEIVRLFLEDGRVDIDQEDGIMWRSPLSLAAGHGKVDVVRLLLENGADVDSRKGYRCRTPLSFAAGKLDEDVVKLLLDSGADANSIDDEGKTPLFYALEGEYRHETTKEDGNPKMATICEWLLRAGADPDFVLALGDPAERVVGKWGVTPLRLAVYGGWVDVVKLLLGTGRVNLDVVDRNGRSIMMLAKDKGREDVIKLLEEATGRKIEDVEEWWEDTTLDEEDLVLFRELLFYQ